MPEEERAATTVGPVEHVERDQIGHGQGSDR